MPRSIFISLFVILTLFSAPSLAGVSAQTVQSTSANAIFNIDLSYGMTVPDVMNLQRVLNGDPATKLNVPAGSAGSLGYETTYFGRATEDAVKRFQKKYSLTETGKADQATRRQLDIVASAFGIRPLVTPTPATSPVSGGATNQSATSNQGVSAPTTGAPSSSGIAIFGKDLYLGMDDTDVRVLQRVLNIDPATKLNVPAGSAGSLGYETTYFGGATQNAVIRFQQKYSISPASGYVGPKTRYVLNQLAVLRAKDVFWGSVGVPGVYANDTGAPSADLKVNGSDGPISVNIGTTVTLSWSSANTTSCESSTQSKPTSGTQTFVVQTSGVFTLACKGKNGVSVADSVQVNALSNGQAYYSNTSANTSYGSQASGFNGTSATTYSVDLKINGSDSPSAVASGTAVSVSWTSQNVSGCSFVSGLDLFSQTFFDSLANTSGSMVLNVKKAGTLQLRCTTAQNNSISDSVYLGLTWASPTSSNIGTSGSTSGLNFQVPQTAPVYFGYGPVNWWTQINPNQLAADLKAAGLNLTQIEYLGPSNQFNGVSVPGPEVEVTVLRPLLKQFVAAMRAQGITTMITIANWNSPYRTMYPTSFFNGIASFIATEIGSDKIILEPISERTSTKQGQPDMNAVGQILAYAESAFKGDMAWNVVGAADIVPARYRFGDYHLAHMDSSPANNPGTGKITLVSSDHSTLLAELGSNGTREDQTFDPVKVKAWACANIKKGYSLIAYGFWHKQIDEGTIAALGQVMKEGVNCNEDEGIIEEETPGPTVFFSGVVTDIRKCETMSEHGTPNSNHYIQLIIKPCGADPVTPGYTKPGQLGSFFMGPNSDGPMPKVGDVVIGSAGQDHWTICGETVEGNTGYKYGASQSDAMVQPVGHVKEIGSGANTVGQCTPVNGGVLLENGSVNPSASLFTGVGLQTLGFIFGGPAGWYNARMVENAIENPASGIGSAVGFVVGGFTPIGAIIGGAVGNEVGNAIGDVFGW